MMIGWFPLVVVYIFTNAASKLLQKYSVQDETVEPAAYSAFFMLTVGLMTIPFVFFEQVIYPTDPMIWLVVLLSGVFYTICMLLFFTALKQIEVSQVEAIATTRTIWLMLLGVIFFKEQLYASQVAGIFFIFFGLVVIYWQRGSTFHISRPHVYTLVYAILISGAYALDKFLLGYFSVALFQVVIYTIPALLTLLFIPNALKKFAPLLQPKKNNAIILLCCSLQMISTLALYAAYQIGELSIIGPLAQTSIILTIIVGLVVLKERWNLTRKLCGIGLSIIGILLIRFIVF